jgi:flagellar protein FlbD
MIFLHKINGEEFLLNSDHIELVIRGSDTIIQLTNGKHMMVKESPEEIIRLVVEFRQQIFSNVKIIKDTEN